MVKMTYYLKLVRYKNLLIIALSQYSLRYLILFPILKIYGFDLVLSDLDFAILVLSTMCLAGAGYVINDYFDRKADLINRPDSVIVGTKILRRKAMVFHSVLNVVGVAAGVYLSFRINIPYFGFVFLFITGILWFYSTTYKKIVFAGNFIVALLTALVTMMVLFFELPPISEKFHSAVLFDEAAYNMLIYSLGISFFAFITTFIREIIKDFEDIKGDRENNRKTVPIVFGNFVSKIILMVLIFSMIFSLMFSYFYYLQHIRFYDSHLIILAYIILCLIVPIIILTLKLIGAVTQPDFKKLSKYMKLIMLSGLLFTVLSYFLMIEKF